MAPTALVVMGVSGSGKSTVGKALAQRLHWPYEDGDALHSPANVAKMAAGIPLTDADRWPWLERIERSIAETFHAGSSCVVACSALRKSYRDLLRGAVGTDPRAAVRFVFLDVDRDLLRQRLIARHGHFMHANMLASQLATLEPPTAEEQSITVRVTADTDPLVAVDKIITALDGPSRDPTVTPNHRT